jgi:iron/zinc/copper transport system permease protein
MMAVAAILGALSSLVGLFVSYYLNIASGAAVVLCATLFFILAYFFSPQKGLLFRNR